MTKELIEELYSNIQGCRLCKSTVSEKVNRKVDLVNIHSEVFIIVEAMAPMHVRVSGINYFEEC